MLDFAVVGGGPAGLGVAHAILRARPGARVAVLERSDLRPRGATFGLLPNGLRAIAAIDPRLEAALLGHHLEHEKKERFDPEGAPATSQREQPNAVIKKRQPGESISLPWHKLQRELADALPQGVLHLEHKFLGYEETAEGVAAQFATPQGVRTVQARLLVGCDGGQSAVREQMLGDGPPQFLGMAVWRAVAAVPATWPHKYALWGRLGQSLITGVLPDGKTMTWQAFAPWPADQLALIGGGRKAYVQEMDAATLKAEAGGQESAEEVGRARLQRAIGAFGSFPQHVQDMMAGTDPLAVTEHGQFCRDAETCQTYARGRVALVGDAAHLATPFLGQGCSQAMEDALELGRAVGQHGPTPEALAAYQHIRLPLASAVQEASVELCRGFASGKVDKTELEVNKEKGFTMRQHNPLVPTGGQAVSS